MSIKQLTPVEAHEVLQNDPEAVYLDVRTEPEFAAGHPEGAINIPVAFPNPGGGLRMNPDFVKVVEKVLPRERAIVCGCQAGVRSQAAADLLSSVGYTELVNVQGGYGGKVNPSTGTVAIPGWRDSGLPVSSEVNGENSYDGLKKKAEA